MFFRDAFIMSHTLGKNIKFIYKFNQILSSLNFVPVFCYHKLKYPSEIKLLQKRLASNIGRNDQYCKNSVNENGELVSSVEDPTQPLVKLTIITKVGKEVPIEARVGMTVMKAIIKHKHLEMEATCGGELACTTCHVYCEEKEKYFTPVREMEQDLLDAVPCSTDDSRLCCQMKIIKEFGNVRIQLPTDTTNYFTEGAKKV